ncbi:hypothetical protein CCAX7_51350 [Capsulimonas corticalis]|uniref:Uncharacterized protein n=1 Tax=Capsulimonas corticalis TaxID=2219043 RepID=A0A402CP88_9BACT|nr:family 43 glycosylhydrolase [Capsulimonas corticalis]BDI33084.1 hypothetical protein CCAX7_51350 [Capsulimonas corticalis]
MTGVYKRKQRFLTMRLTAFGALTLLAAPWSAHAQSPASFTYQNPMPRGVVDGLRDPYIVNVDGVWYMTGTAKPFFQFQYATLGANPGVPLYSSTDLKTWTYRGIIVPRVQGSWYQDNFWAPEIHVKSVNGVRRFYCTFNGDNADQNSPEGVGLAVANNITGPYTVLTPNAPLTYGNDGGIFTDSDGNDYLFIAGISAMPIDLANARVTGAAWPVLGPSPTPQWDGGTGVGVEDPDVIKIGATYYCFYSSWGCGYGAGYATATNIHGPWTKYAANPIYGAQNPAACAASGAAYTQAPNVPYREIGGGAPFVGPDGRWWLSAHFALINPDPATTQYWGWEQPGFDPLPFQNGAFLPQTPSWTAQSVPLPLTSGLYALTNAASGFALDDTNWATTAGNLIELWDAWYGPPQQWRFTLQPDGSYTLTSSLANMNIDDPNGLNTWGQHLQLWYPNGATAQNWLLSPQADGAYTLNNVAAGLALDDPNGLGPHGTLVQLWPANGAPAQEWRLTRQ